MKNILYLAFYSGETKERTTSPAGETMTKYTLDVLSRLGQQVFLISPAQSSLGKNLSRKESDLDNKKIIYINSLSKAKKYNIIKRLVRKISWKKAVEKEIKRFISQSNVLIVYHSLALMPIVKKIRRDYNIKLLLQVCEVYSDVTGNKKEKIKELNYLKNADAYIFQTELLDKKINVENKPSTIIYGAYNDEKECGQPFNDWRIHVVYAGTFDPRKGGVQAAAAAEFLNGNYHVHILGFGAEHDKKQLLEIIESVSKKTECVVTFDGLKSGEDYIKFIQSCDIGLSTQNPDAEFNATSFPSKILSYMSNGLRVVSVRIPAIEQSAVGDYMYYYDKQTPKEIAKAIMQVGLPCKGYT